MSDRLDHIVADLRRYLEQQREAGHERHFFDDAVVIAARERAAERAAASGSAAAGVARPAGEAADIGRANTDDKAQQLRELDEDQVRGCTKCKLHGGRTNTVFGVGNPDAGIVFVGEAPGRDEDLQGEPFVGRAGQLLTKILKAIGLERDDVYICNVLKCRPPNNRDPEADEVVHCEPYLLRQLEIIQPKVICALGRIAAQTLLQTRDSLTRMRATTHDYHGIPMIVTYHPAALLRNPNWKRPAWEDVQKLRALHDELSG
jgi:DNA polymerase